MSIEEFNHQHMSHILEKILFYNKEVYLLGDFNTNLLNYETDRPRAEFLEYTQIVLFIISLSQLTSQLDRKH